MSDEMMERPRIEAATELTAFERNILMDLAEEARYGLGTNAISKRTTTTMSRPPVR